MVEIDERVVVEPGERWFAHVVAVAAVLAAVSFLLVIALTTGWTAVIVWASAASLAVVALAGIGRDHASEVGRWMKEKLALALVLLAGFGIPTVTLLFTTGLFDALRGDIGRALEPELSGVVTLRALQVLFLGIAIVFPALLYFLFDRQRADTLRTRFVFSMFRLDPRVRSRPDVDALYGRQMEEAFGAQLSRRPTRQLRFRHRSPMVITTVVLAVGWIVALINLDAIPLGGPEAPLDLSRLFEPESNVLAFGFLGAYFFAVNSVLRSYVRGDLQPKAYSQITARVLVVAVLASVVAMTELGGNRLVVAVAFFAGIVPDTVLQWTWEGVRQLRPGKTVGHRRAGGRDNERDLMSENQPLTELDGIDLYERARLAAEGVANVEALAHGNLVDLLLQTRIPAGRLVDWVDQSVLSAHGDRAHRARVARARPVRPAAGARDPHRDRPARRHARRRGAPEPAASHRRQAPQCRAARPPPPRHGRRRVDGEPARLAEERTTSADHHPRPTAAPCRCRRRPPTAATAHDTLGR